MKCVVCDRCGKIIKGDIMKIGIGVEDEGTIVHLSNYDHIQALDICDDCLQKIVSFIETPGAGAESPQEHTKEEDEEQPAREEEAARNGQKYDREWIYRAYKAGASAESIATHLKTSPLTIHYIIRKKEQEEQNENQKQDSGE